MIREKTEGDEWRLQALHLMRRMFDIGFNKAVAEELEAPQLPDDEQWCRFIVSLAKDAAEDALRRRRIVETGRSPAKATPRPPGS